MHYLKVEAIIKIDENCFSFNDSEEKDWFKAILNDKENTIIQIWSNDIGDEICSSNDFKWTLLSEI